MGGLADLARALPAGDTMSLATLDEHAWAAALGRLLADEGARRAAAAGGAALVRERFRWSAVAARLSTIYAEVLSERA